MKIFCKRLKGLRNKRKLRQIDLAKILGVSNSSISDWERGRNHPDTNMIIQLADYFEVSIDYLIGRKDS